MRTKNSPWHCLCWAVHHVPLETSSQPSCEDMNRSGGDEICIHMHFYFCKVRSLGWFSCQHTTRWSHVPGLLVLMPLGNSSITIFKDYMWIDMAGVIRCHFWYGL
jgi:hypothetical protein